jgi:hypothetical protein
LTNEIVERSNFGKENNPIVVDYQNNPEKDYIAAPSSSSGSFLSIEKNKLICKLI